MSQPQLVPKVRPIRSGLNPATVPTLVLLIFFMSLFTSAGGQGNLLISPRRVVFEGPKRSMELNLANTGKDTATYAISMIQIRMTENGGFETITEPDPGQRFADRNIRFFPRSVTLGPNEAQTVKVQLIRTNELTPGEYRSHFYFRSIPKAVPLGQAEAPKDTTTISVKLTPIFGITIPAIIRVGESTAKVTLSDLSLDLTADTIPRISMVFNRTGNMSVYGDISVDHISGQGKITRVGIANGVAVYTPNQKRMFQFSLNKVPGVDFRSGTIRVIFSASSDVTPVRLAESELPLN
ncbi:MAG: Fn3-like domain-containing protein [Bacteroidales bacterium]